MTWFNPTMTRQGTILDSSREQGDALRDNQGSLLSVILVAQEVDSLKQQLVEAFACIRRLNESLRVQDVELAKLRAYLAQTNEDMGFEFEGAHVITRSAAAKLLKRSTRTLKRWEKTKQLHPKFPFPNQAYYRQSEVKALLDLCASAGSGPAISRRMVTRSPPGC